MAYTEVANHVRSELTKTRAASAMAHTKNKRLQRLSRWRHLTNIAASLPEHRAQKAAHRLTAWLDRNEPALRAALEMPGEDLPGGGIQDIGVWAEFQDRVNRFATEAMGVSSGAALSLVGMTAFERELLERLNSAGVKPIAIKPEQIKRVEKKVQASMRGKGQNRGQPPSDKNRERTPAILPSVAAKKPLNETVATTTMDPRQKEQRVIVQHVGAATSQPTTPNIGMVSRETVKEWLRAPDAINNEKRLVIKQVQNQQWRALYDAKHDPARIKQQQLERLAYSGMKPKAYAKTLVVPVPNSAASSRKSRPSATRTAPPVGQMATVDDPNEVLRRSELFKEQMRHKKSLARRLRTSLQAKFTKTQTLPMDLFRAFQKYDGDQSGNIDFDEFRNVCDFAGLGAGVLSVQDQRTLFEQADADGGGTVDFAEFLKVVVGNLVSL